MNAHTSIDDAVFRAQHVGASEVAALFDCHPWLTRFELFHRKRGTIATPDFAQDERMSWGTLLEPVILDEACRRYDWEPVETPGRLSNGRGLGGHPDRLVRRADGKIGVVEAKAVDWLQVKKWGDEPPANYLLQPQSYCGLAKVEWCAFSVLVCGNELRRFEYDFRPGLYAEIEKRVEAFWTDVAAGNAPRPDYARDGDTLVEVLGEPTEEVCDLRADREADDIAAEWLMAKEAERAAKTRQDVAECRLLEKVGTASVALMGLHRLSANQTKGTPDRVATAGEIIKGRRGYRRFAIKEIEA